MGKYDPLKVFLESQSGDRTPVRFDELEQLLGFRLPKSKKYPAWWSNSPTNNVMTKVWLDAGFVTEQVDTASERLVFRRVRKPIAPGAQAGALRGPYPGFGAMRGTVRFAAGFDPTQPADPAWGARDP